MCFLEESWLLVLSQRSSIPQLLVLNTLLPQQDPTSWRIFNLPTFLKPDTYHRIFTQYERPLTEHPEFSVDPVQRNFVLFYNRAQALVVPVELLVRRMYRMRTSPRIPWDEWGKDVIAVCLPPDARTFQLYDTKLLALCGSVNLQEWDVLTYDLSKSGLRDIQQVREGVGAECRGVFPTPRQRTRYEIRDGFPYNTQVVGNQVLCFFVSPIYVQRRSCRVQGYTT
jgi:hypothetical protein